MLENRFALHYGKPEWQPNRFPLIPQGGLLKTTLLLTILLTLTAALTAQTNLPEYWHPYQDEVIDIMFELEANYPDIAKVYEIGSSNGADYIDPIPIYALKISDNVAVNEDEPGVLFVGQCHAEEVIGVEIVVDNMQTICEFNQQAMVNRWITNLEMWFVPTINPEGNYWVMWEDDPSIRKTMRDNDMDGVFDYEPTVGNDLDGVDPNRNYDFGWVHGDTLYSTNGEELYDYYRGPYPFSEGGTTAIKNLGEQEKFLYSINWHSSRTGNYSEKVFYPWHFYQQPGREAPDLAINQYIGEAVAGEIQRIGASGFYEPSASMGRIGKSTQWFYAALGTIQLTIETSLLQPDEPTLQQVIGYCNNGVYWLLNFACEQCEIVPVMSGHVTCAVTGDPLEARITVLEKHSPYFSPRYTEPVYGRFWRVIEAGTYTVRAEKKGYATFEGPVTVNPSGCVAMNIQLQPLTLGEYTGTVTCDGNPVPARIVVFDEQNHTIDTDDGHFTIPIYEGTRTVHVTSPGCYPWIGDFNAQPGPHGLHFQLSPANELFADDFEGTLEQWTVEGPWQIIDEEAHDGHAVTDSWGGYGFYEAGCDVSITTAQPVDLSGQSGAMLTFWSHVYTEPYFDPVTVEISQDGSEWTELYRDSGKKDFWHPVFVSLDEYTDGAWYFRFRLQDDSPDPRLVDPGWTLDEIRIIGGAATETGTTGNEDAPSLPTGLGQNYPNPFNPETTIAFTIGNPVRESAALEIFNVRGQMIETIDLTAAQIDAGRVKWNARGQASGIYFYRLNVDGVPTSTRRAVLLK